MQIDQSNSLSIYIFRYSDIDSQLLAKSADNLSSAEQERCAKLNEPRARQYIYERSCLRKLLAERLQCEPNQINIKTTDKGKPYLSSISNNGALNRSEESGIEFNLSHCDKIFAIAISERAAVGIDIETSKRSNSIKSIAKHCFSDEEKNLLDNVSMQSENQYKRRFIQLWTIKEAIGKLLGRGINKTFLQNTLSIQKGLITANSKWLEQKVCYASFELAPYYLSIAVQGDTFPEISIHDSVGDWRQALNINSGYEF